MSDSSTTHTSGLVIPADTQAAFGALLVLIQGSESMNMEERQYWINILPVMTPEQLKNLEEILTSEKKQLKAIDEKYSKEVGKVDDTASILSMEQKMKSQKEKRISTEEENEEMEAEKEAQLLSKIQSL
jgi:hypothetical protein